MSTPSILPLAKPMDGNVGMQHVPCTSTALTLFTNRYSVRKNLTLDNMEEMQRELGLFKSSGGGTVCELSCIGIRCTPHKPERLKHLSQQTGVNIVHATGFYCNKFLPESAHALSVAEMRDVMLKELCVGAAESDVRCGVIYLGCSWPLHTTEERALRAAAAVQAAQGNVVCTGCTCMSIIHVLYMYEKLLQCT